MFCSVMVIEGVVAVRAECILGNRGWAEWSLRSLRLHLGQGAGGVGSFLKFKGQKCTITGKYQCRQKCCPSIGADYTAPSSPSSLLFC